MKAVSRHIAVVIVAAVSLCHVPCAEGVGLSSFVSRLAAWWDARSVSSDTLSLSAAQTTGSDSSDYGTKSGSDSTGGTAGSGTAASGTSAMCKVSTEPSKTVCKAGSEFLCVDTPVGGVVADSFVLYGMIDRKNSVLTSIQIASQNEYTKKTSLVDTSSPVEGDCSNGPPSGKTFCLGSDGRFAATIPLPYKGPYTVLVSASRVSGGSSEKRVRVSRVTSLTLSDKNVSFSPDIRTQTDIQASLVTTTVSLLDNCQSCDFIGSSTNGVRVTVENVIKDAAGSTKKVDCSTTVEQGGAGKFVVGVPTGAGTNTITVEACNVASETGKCPKVGPISFKASGSASTATFKIFSPPPQPSYDSVKYPSIKWEFAAGDGKECVGVQFNRDSLKKMCPDTSGRFTLDLTPRVGINVASVSRGDGAEEFAWTFGWGKIKSPFENSNGTIDVSRAAAFAIPAKTFDRVFVPLANSFLGSASLSKFIDTLFGKSDSMPKSSADKSATIDIPQCKESGSLEGFDIALRGKPQIGGAKIEKVSFDKGRVDLSLSLKDVRLGIDLIPDKNGDGVADKDPLPLVVAFKGAVAEIALNVSKDKDGKSLLLLTSPHDDCSFKSGSYCKHLPAALIPQNFVGNASALGSFIACDVDTAGDDAKDACRAINSLNAQTGIIAEGVLDAINNGIYCGGSAWLTSLARDGIKLPEIQTGSAGTGGWTDIFSHALSSVRFPIAIKFEDDIEISKSGIQLSLAAVVGDSKLYALTPNAFRIPTAGIVTDPTPGDPADALLSGQAQDLSVALSFDAIDALLYAGAAQNDGRKQRGLFDIDVDEDYFRKTAGFDFVKQCDAVVLKQGEKLHPLCFARPTVGKLLGSALTKYGYFQANQPLLVAVRGNRALGARMSVKTIGEVPVISRASGGSGKGSGYVPTNSIVEVELGGVEFSFYALEVDKSQKADAYGNLPIKRDKDGNPVIQSMKSGDSDPRNGPIGSFDLTLFLAIEIGPIQADPSDGSKSSISLRILSDRSRLVFVPIEGTNSTLVPSTQLISQLSAMLNIAMTDASSKAITISVPRKIEFDPGDLIGLDGLNNITLEDILLNFDAAQNSVLIAPSRLR